MTPKKQAEQKVDNALSKLTPVDEVPTANEISGPFNSEVQRRGF
jgi:hypothetical protein